MTIRVCFAQFSVALSLSLFLLPNVAAARSAGMSTARPSAAPAFRSPPVARPAPAAPTTAVRPASSTPFVQRPPFLRSPNGLLSRGHDPRDLHSLRGARRYSWQPGYWGSGYYYDPSGPVLGPSDDPQRAYPEGYAPAAGYYHPATAPRNMCAYPGRKVARPPSISLGADGGGETGSTSTASATTHSRAAGDFPAAEARRAGVRSRATQNNCLPTKISLASPLNTNYVSGRPISHVPVAACQSVGIRTRGRTAA
jgi:hypothetical protein